MHKDFISSIRLRSRVIFEIERFFQNQNYISVHTPALSSHLIPERHIDVFALASSDNEYDNESGKGTNSPPKKYLVPSPEIHLKPLLASMGEHIKTDQNTLPSIYEFSHSFRKEAMQDAIHDEEFLMLEWYRAYANIQDCLETCNNILYTIRNTLLEKKFTTPLWINHIENTLTLEMEEAFESFVGISLQTFIDCPTAYDAIQYAGIQTLLHNAHSYDWEDVFHFILVEKIEPKLPMDRPVYLTHYPSRVDTLAKQNINNSALSERWELYIQGIEIANCYEEETDGEKIHQYMIRQKEKMPKQQTEQQNARPSGIPYDENFLQSPPLPPYAGVAMGIDRLILCLLKTQNNNFGLADISPLSFSIR